MAIIPNTKLTKQGFIVNKSDLTNSQIEMIENDLTIEPEVDSRFKNLGKTGKGKKTKNSKTAKSAKAKSAKAKSAKNVVYDSESDKEESES